MKFDHLTKLKWVWYWTGNWPLFDNFTERDEEFEKAFYKLAGISPKISVDFYHNGILTAYHCQEEYERLGKFLNLRFEKKPHFILNSLNDFADRTNGDIAELENVHSLAPG